MDWSLLLKDTKKKTPQKNVKNSFVAGFQRKEKVRLNKDNLTEETELSSVQYRCREKDVN